jgi:hypothetical protein
MSEPSSRGRPRSGGPREPHPVRETHDSGIAAVASRGDYPFGAEIHAVTATTAFLRSTRCAFPGCGRPREDPVHDLPGA